VQPTALQPSPLLHDIKTACHLLGISAPTLYRANAAGKAKLVHLMGRTFMPDDEVRRLANEGTSPFLPLRFRQTRTRSKRGRPAKVAPLECEGA
jgi:hypothetical protein